MEIVCRSADKLVSSGDAILIQWLKIDWINWNDDYVHLMIIISKLDMEVDSKFHFLEWNSELEHKDEMGSYYLNPWKTDLETGVGVAPNEKAIDLLVFF